MTMMTLRDLAERIGATVIGDGSIEVDSCAPIQSAGPTQLAFLSNPSYHKYLHSTNGAAVLIDPRTACPAQLNRLVVEDPYFAFCHAMIALHGHRQHPAPMDAAGGDAARPSISPRAAVHPSASVGADTRVHPFVTIEASASVGSGCVLYPGVFIGPEARIGDGCVLFPNAVVYDRCVLGDRVTLHANTVVGQDGFGYATHEGRHHKIPQSGIVVLEDDVELGAGCAIERAAMGETRIGRGTKFADLISIGHGTTVGEHCLFVSLVGVAGSVEVGNYVVLGGQAGVVGHLKIGDGAQAAGRAAITSDIPAGVKVAGTPAIDLQQAKRNALVANDLYGLLRRLRKLERALEASGPEDTPSTG